VIKPKWLAWHAFTVVAVIGMLWLGDWQFHRAEGGNALSWAYTFEWPVFAAFGIVFWVKTILDEGKPKAVAVAGQPGDATISDRLDGAGLPAGARRRSDGDLIDDAEPDDPELDEYNAYLAQLNKQVQGQGKN